VRRSSINCAPARSCTSAGWTTKFKSKPSVSTRICRLRPVTFLPHQDPASRARRPFLGDLGALAVDDGGRRARFPLFVLAPRDIELVMYAFQGAIRLPEHEVGMRRLFGGHPSATLAIGSRSRARSRPHSRLPGHRSRGVGRHVLAVGIIGSIAAHSLSDRSDSAGRDDQRIGNVRAPTCGTAVIWAP
jgi:hypothetical protein